jgi:hypothetical protein
MLARARTMNALEKAQDAKYRLTLERGLKHLDAEIAALEVTNSESKPGDRF